MVQNDFANCFSTNFERMKSKLSIYKSGLLLTLIPAAVSCLLVICLNFMLGQAEDDARKSEQTCTASQLKNDLDIQRREQETKMRRQLRNLVWLILAFILSTTALFTVYFLEAIVKRLRIMQDNSLRLAANLPLNPPVDGDDELASVDKAFHLMAQSLADSKEKERQSELMRQDIVRMVTHDIRSPLNTVKVFLEFLNAGVAGDVNERGQRMLKNSEICCERIVDLINDFLDAEKLNSGAIELRLSSIELISIFDESLASVSSWAELKKVQLNIEQTALTVRCDKDRIVQVVVNLLANAIKFSPELSSVSLRVEALEKMAEIQVVDQGRGIPADKREFIFEKFTQANDADALVGTGLGLNICKSIIDLHGGEIGVRSEEGLGSIFWFRIALAETV